MSAPLEITAEERQAAAVALWGTDTANADQTVDRVIKAINEHRAGPHLSSLQPDTLTEVVDGHAHYKHVDVELLRVPAHLEGRVRIVPDKDRSFTAEKTGMYRIAVHDNDHELLWVDLPPMQSGDVLDSLTVSVSMPSVGGW
jgi:hypothetical protein